MKLRSALIAVTLLAGMSLPARALTPPMSLSQEAVYLLRDYLKIDTTNPPGHEMATAKFLKAILDREGIENQIFDLGDGRANLMAVLHGDGSKRPLVLLHHMDVVPADPQYWSAPPFSGELRNGVIYGRGAIDIKGKGIVDLMTLVRLKRDKTPLKRDIVFLAVADEEVSSIGSRWMIEHQADFLK
ncbi:MAG: M20 family metallopeptidase, partial [Candidatus Sericytochromatia bacterium]